jgi:hypothetical protein
MRMSNERDQAFVRSAISDAAANLLGFVPSLGTREVFAFGEAVAIPTRLRFKQLPKHALPRSEAISSADTDFGRSVDPDFIDFVVERWRSATLSTRVRPENAPEAAAAPAQAVKPATAAAAPASGAPRLDPDRYRLLKRAAKLGPG